MITTGLQPDPRKFLHQCEHCTRKYRVTIRVDIFTVHRAACPHCGKMNFFDNKNGQIQNLVEGKSLAPSSATHVAPAAVRPAAPGANGTSPGSPGPAAPATRQELPSFRSGRGPQIHAWQSESPGRPREQAPPRPEAGGHGGVFTPRPGPARRDFFQSGQAGGVDLLQKLGELINVRLALMIGVGFVLVALFGGLAFMRFSLPGMSGDMEEYTARLRVIQPNRIVDRDGKLLAELFSRRTGTMRSEEIPATLKQKLIFVEDQNFFTHGGIDYPALIRALVQNTLSMGYVQGGSTLTQQLARILLGSREKVIGRKLREANLAYYLEKRYSKDEILTAYMNHVYLGHGSVGMDVAARFYFGLGLNELNFVQELILVSLPSAPERYSPLKNPIGLQAKMDTVYVRMREENFTDLPVEQYNAMKAAVFVGLNRSPNSNVFGSRVDHAPFVTEYVRLKIREILGEEFEFGAGLVVETTISAGVMDTVARETERYMAKAGTSFPPVRFVDGKRVDRQDLETRLAREYHRQGLGAVLFGFPAADTSDQVLQAAAVGLRPETGEVLFVQGGRRFSSGNQYNRALHMYRQTGSAIKPVVYSTGIETGQITPSTLVDDSPIYVPLRKEHSGGKGYWLPQNITGKYEGLIPVRRAFAQSKNIPAIRVARIVGMPRLSEQFRRFFFHDDASFQKRFRPDQTIAIGSLEMSPLEMAVAFGAFGDDGRIHRPFLIKRILDRDGKEIYNAADKDEFRLGIPREHQAIPPDVAQIMATMLADSARFGGVARGGLKNPRLLGKTGTSNDYRDTWFVGLLPGISAAVWVGYDNPRYSMQGGTGAGVAGPLWGTLISRVEKILPPPTQKEWKYSQSGVRQAICIQSGKLPGAHCPVVTEWHRKEHLPAETCPLEHFDPGAYDQDWSLNSDSDFE